MSGTASTRTGARFCSGSNRPQGDQLTAVYAVGPSVDNEHDAVWTRRKGRVTEDGFVFQEQGKSTLQFRPRQDGGLSRDMDLGRRQDLDDRVAEADRPRRADRAADAR